MVERNEASPENEKSSDILEINVSLEQGLMLLLAGIFLLGAFQFLQLKTLDVALAQQAGQIQSISSASLAATQSTASAAVPAAPAQNTAADSTQGVPNMVGGC